MISRKINDVLLVTITVYIFAVSSIKTIADDAIISEPTAIIISKGYAVAVVGLVISYSLLQIIDSKFEEMDFFKWVIKNAYPYLLFNLILCSIFIYLIMFSETLKGDLDTYIAVFILFFNVGCPVGGALFLSGAVIAGYGITEYHKVLFVASVFLFIIAIIITCQAAHYLEQIISSIQYNNMIEEFIYKNLTGI